MFNFYSKNIDNGFGSLEGDEAGHCSRVLRKQEGDFITVIDGVGGSHECVISSISKKVVEFEVKSSIQYERGSGYIELVVAPTKNISRIEWLLEKATEIGVDSICFIQCNHSERKVVKLERLTKILVSAMKQSGNLYLPTLKDLNSFKSVLSEPFDGSRLYGSCDSSEKRLMDFKGLDQVQFWIGPEGDFSTEEVDFLKSEGVKPVSLSQSRLRTETAALVAVCQLRTLI